MSASVVLTLILCTVWQLSCGFSLDKNGVVLPNDPYVYIGANLTMHCNLTKFDSTYNSRNLFFSRHKDEIIPTRYVSVVSTRSIVLRFPINSPEDGGQYICKLNKTGNRPELIGHQYVMVEYEPKPVREINCRVYNWENMTCTWDLGVKFIHPNFINVTLVWTTSGTQLDCKQQTMTSCKWPAVDGEDYFIADVDYNMAVIIENRGTKPKPTSYPNKARVQLINTMELVEPAPPVGLKAEKNSSCIKLTWSHEKTRRDKVYRVYFRSEKDRMWQKKSVGDAEDIVLCGLQPYIQYDFNVSCKPRLVNKQIKGFWSKDAIITVRTTEDVPSAAPVLNPGSYMETPCQHYCKQLMLYWKPLDLDDSNGNITYYRIDYRNVNTGSDWDTASSTETQRLLMLIASDSYVIQIRAATKKGVSNLYTEIFVPTESKKPPIPDHIVTAHNLSQETLITIMWKPPKEYTSSAWRNLTSYTVFWCKGYKIERRCPEPIQSREVALSQTEITLHVSLFETHMFGVAVNAEMWTGEIISSGFKWNTCTYVKNSKPEIPPKNVHLSVYQPNNGLTLEWDRLTCSDTVAYVQQYIISLCPAIRGGNCTDDTHQYSVANTVNTFTLKNLVEGRVYRLWMRAVATDGQGPESEFYYGVVIDRGLKPEEIGGIAVAAFFVLIVFLFGIILCFRRVFRTMKQKYFVPVPIEIPHTLPPLPPIPMPPREDTPESESSDGIYEKIDGPPSPSSSTESTTGVEAPLIHSKWKLSNLKNQIYSKKKTQRHSNDSGRSSISHSADTLLMRLHPSHFKRNKKSKKSNKSESDSGVIIDGRGQVSSYHSGQSKDNDADFAENQTLYDFGGEKSAQTSSDVNPYSCVDIVDKINSERLNRKVAENSLDLENPTPHEYTGSTLSLPPGFCKVSSSLPQSLYLKAHSTGNELDFDDNRLCSMTEGKEFESSDIYSEAGTLDSIDDHEHETSESLTSQDNVNRSHDSSDSHIGAINSYVKFLNGETMELSDEVFGQNGTPTDLSCDCGCHRNPQTDISDGYVMATHTPENCGCELSKLNGEVKQIKDWPEEPSQKKARPSSFVHNLPPHFFSSLSSVPVDPATTTEL